MNELKIKTIDIKPAEINFNHAEIEKELDETLKHYQGLVFTKDSTKDLRNTLAELRKGKAAIHEYGVDTRRKLNEPVKDFSDKVKAIESKFDSVIDPLNEQLDEYVQRGRAEKLQKLETVRAEFIKEYELDDEYADQVEIDDSFLNKSTSIKVATESIKFKVENLKMRQDKAKADKQAVEMAVRLANAENDLGFSTEAYIRLLEFDEVEAVQKQIEKDVNKELERRKAEVERKEQERIKEEKKQAELQAEKEKAHNEQMERIKTTIEEDIPVFKVPEVEYKPDVNDIPFVETPDPFAEEPTPTIKIPIIKTYQLMGTEEELQQVEHFLNEIGVEWNDIDE